LRDCWQATEIAAANLDASLPRPLSQSLDDAISALERKSFDSRIAEARAQLARKGTHSGKSRARRSSTKPTKGIRT